jgi:ribosome maturation factor RimP
VSVSAPSTDERLLEDLRGIVEPIVADDGTELVDIIVKGHPGSRVVRIVVDADEGVDVERLARLSRAVSDAFDELDPVKGRYTLQVTSPGTDRPLTTARDFARNVGRSVRITRTEGDPVEGVVVAVEDEVVTVEVDGEDVEVALADVTDGRVLLPW